jgi:hypothetical protein
MKSNKELLSKALDLLHTLEDRTNYDNVKLGTAINLLQDLLPTIDKPVADDVHYKINEEGNKVYDFKDMMNMFESELKRLNERKL